MTVDLRSSLSPAIVVGSAPTVWDDLLALRSIVSSPVYFAVNYMTLLLPIADHAVSHHPEELLHLVALRAHSSAAGTAAVTRTKPVTHSSASAPGVDRVWPQFRKGPNGASGSSSLLAAQIALELGHESVIVVGVPLDAGGYVWGDPHADPHAVGSPMDYTRYRQGWMDAIQVFRGRVTAVSGYLADLLGQPVALADAVLT